MADQSGTSPESPGRENTFRTITFQKYRKIFFFQIEKYSGSMRSIQKCIKNQQFPIGGLAGFFPKKCRQSVRLLLPQFPNNISLLANPRILSIICFKWSVYFYRFVLYKLANLTPKTNNTWRKLRFSAFQQYKCLGLSDGVFLSKSSMACTPQHINPIVLSDWLSTV